MESDTHAVVTSDIAFALQTQVRQLETGYPDSAFGQFAAKIRSTGSATIRLKRLPTKNSHRPDVSFKYEGASFPGIVIEVAHSQRSEDLPQLAADYILGSTGNIRCVYGIKSQISRVSKRGYRLGNQRYAL